MSSRSPCFERASHGTLLKVARSGSRIPPLARVARFAARGVLIVIVAVAGRRIDAPDAAVARFPLANRRLVARRIGAALWRLDATAVVASAACGADLLALDAAGRRGLQRRAILPYAEARVLEDSVLHP